MRVIYAWYDALLEENSGDPIEAYRRFFEYMGEFLDECEEKN